MFQTDYTTRVLRAEEGMMLTQAEDVPMMQRILSREVYLAVNDSPDNWKEISGEEADAIALEIETARKAKEAEDLAALGLSVPDVTPEV